MGELEFQHYLRRKAIDQHSLQVNKSEVKKFRRERKELRKKQRAEKKALRREKRVEVFFKTTEALAKKAINGYFDGLTAIRCHTPNAIGLFEWEKEAVKDLDIDTGELKKKETWKALKEEGRDAKGLFVKFLQDKCIFPERLLRNLADQATTEKNRNSFLDFDKNIKKHLARYVDEAYYENFMHGLTRSFLVAVPQHPEFASASGLLLGGGASAYITSKINAEGNIVNNIERMGPEFATLLNVHYKTHRRALSRNPELAFSKSQIYEISRRIFTGSRFVFEGKMEKLRTKAALAGVSIAHGFNIAASGSLPKALFHVGEAAAAAVSGFYLYRKIYKERTGTAIDDISELQREYYSEMDKVNKDIASQEGRGAGKDWFQETRIPHTREKFVDRLSETRVKTQTPTELTTWVMAGATTGLHEAIQIEDFTPANTLVTAGVIVGALRPLVEELTWSRQDQTRKDDLERVAQMVETINRSVHHIPTHLEEESAREQHGLSKITERKQALSLMVSEPLVIRQVDIGNRWERQVEIKEEIRLEPGTVSFVSAPKGKGKNDLARMLIHEQGNLENYDVRKGLHLIQVPSELGLLTLREAAATEDEKTIAEQIVPFVLSSEDNLFKQELINMKHPNNHLKVLAYSNSSSLDSLSLPHVNKHTLENWQAAAIMHGEEERNKIIDILLSDDIQREEWLQKWATNPSHGKRTGEDIFEYPEYSDLPDSKIASAILTVATTNYLHKVFNNITTPDEAAKYLASIPGPLYGTSAGEGALWQARKLLTQELAVGILDEPTAHLGGENIILLLHNNMKKENPIYDDSYIRVAALIEEYLERFPDAVLLIIEHDQKLKQELEARSQLHIYNGERRLVDQEIIVNDELSDSQRVVWETVEQKRKRKAI